jgi:hypothetical protein
MLIICLSLSLSSARGQDHAEHFLHIDIPVKLEKANVVFDIGHAVYVGDMPFVIGDVAPHNSTCTPCFIYPAISVP